LEKRRPLIALGAEEKPSVKSIIQIQKKGKKKSSSFGSGEKKGRKGLLKRNIVKRKGTVFDPVDLEEKGGN